MSDFENALTPYLQARIARAVSASAAYVPSQADYMTLAKYWSFFSEEFKVLYAKAVQIPPGLKTYNSPGGHYQIIYTTSGIDSVDVTDTMGYSSTDWRDRRHGANGIPDYVDWVGFAADSAWSMEIDRFGFDTAYPYTGNGYSPSRTKIYITASLGSSVYGQTFPDGPMPGGIGFRSHIEMLNNWSSFRGSGFDYYIHPEKAIRVTCVHENFHTIQYAMTRQLVDQFIPEDFPASWIEGSAVLMEDLGFNYVHDYFQYLPDYFDDPLQPVLEPTNYSDNTMYKNGIVTIYLYQFTADTPCICFIKNMFFNDYHNPVSFVNNLRSSAAQNGRVWADLLGGFHTGSYYTGTRAVQGRFIKDAGLIMDEWSYGSDGLTSGQALTKTVNPFAMNTFSFVRQNGNSDILLIEFSGDSLNKGETDTNTVWSVHCIAKKDNVPADDSVFAIPVFSMRRGLAEIDGWHNFKEALVIVTNARYGLSRNATVTFEACSVTVNKGSVAYFTALPSAASGGPNATVAVQAKADLLCGISITPTPIGQQLLNSAATLLLNPVGTFYNVFFPASWLNEASLNLSISEPVASLHFASDTTIIPDSSLSVYRWDASTAQWRISPTTAGKLSNSTSVFQCGIDSSGIFGLFGACISVNKGNNARYYAFPNTSSNAQNGMVDVHANADLPCRLSITRASNQELTDSASRQGIIPFGMFYDVSFPGLWQDNATMNLTISEPKDSLHFGPDKAWRSDTVMSVYRWDSSAARWVQCPTSASMLSDSTYVFRCSVASSGIFGLFGPRATSNNIVVYPNPVRLKSDKPIIFGGIDISEVWVYSIDGFLLAHASQSGAMDPSMTKEDFFEWKLRSNRGKAVSPGVYYAYIGYADVLTKAIKKKAQKIFVLP